MARSALIASRLSKPELWVNGSSRAGSVPEKAPSQDEVFAKFSFRPTKTRGDMAMDGTTMVGTV